MNFFQKFRDFVRNPSHARTLGILVILVLVAAVSLTVIMSQRQQTIKQRAAGEEFCNVDPPLPECSSIGLFQNCTTQGSKCRFGITIYECQPETPAN